MKFRIIAYHASVITKLYPHSEEFNIEADTVEKAKESFHETYPDYIIDNVQIISMD